MPRPQPGSGCEQRMREQGAQPEPAERRRSTRTTEVTAKTGAKRRRGGGKEEAWARTQPATLALVADNLPLADGGAHGGLHTLCQAVLSWASSIRCGPLISVNVSSAPLCQLHLRCHHHVGLLILASPPPQRGPPTLHIGCPIVRRRSGNVAAPRAERLAASLTDARDPVVFDFCPCNASGCEDPLMPRASASAPFYT